MFLALAADSGYFTPGGFLPSPWYTGLAVLGWTVLGLLALGAVPAWLLVRARLVAPTVALAFLVHRTGWLQLRALPDDPLPIYFIGWVAFAAALVVVGGAEFVFRAATRRVRPLDSPG